MITITAAPAGRGRFDASVDGRYLCTTKLPLLDGARVLAAQGVDPTTPIGLMHEGSDRITMRSIVGIAAGLTIEESDNGIRLRPYRPSAWEGRAPATEIGSEAPETPQGEGTAL